MNQDGVNVDFTIHCVVVNNSSKESDSKLLKSHSQSLDFVEVIDCPNNPGYFGGLNHGLNMIEDADKRFVVIGNNDLEFDKNFCQELLSSKNLRPHNTQAICPDVVTPEGYLQNPHIPNRISGFRRFQFDVYFSNYYCAVILGFIKSSLLKMNYTSKYRHQNKSLPREIHMGVGACYVLTSAFFEHSSQLNFPTFLYGEEAFLSEQIHSNDGSKYKMPPLECICSDKKASSP